MAGIRIITYVDSDATAAAKCIEANFQFDPQHSDNAALRLGVDRMGYRSIHYLSSLNESRRSLPELRRFADLEVEIQVRTILQHAWAEIEHDRNYKFATVLPEQLERRFRVLAGVLELADREFDSIVQEIDRYAAAAALTTADEPLDRKITISSLRTFMLKKFQQSIELGIVRPTLSPGARMVIGELAAFGITTLAELDAIIPWTLEQAIITNGSENFLGILRHAMIIFDATLYFEKSWEGHWSAISMPWLPERFGIDPNVLASKYSLSIEFGD